MTDKDNDKQSLSGLLNESADTRRIEITLDPYTEMEDQFSKVRQGSMTNTLTKMNLTPSNAEVNPITDIATISSGNLSISLIDFSSATAGLKTSTHKLLDALTSVFTESGAKSPVVHLPFDDYMSMCGLRNKKDARKQIKSDLNTLLHLTLSFSSGNSWDSDFIDVMLCTVAGIIKGVIVLEFSRPVFKALRRYGFMPYPRKLWSLNPQYNPNSYYFLRKISEHKHMNLGKSNEDVISVQTLLSASPIIPKYEDIQKTGQVEQRIIRPFERDMNALSDTLRWEYYFNSGDPLGKDERSLLGYSTFISLILHIEWINYPEQDQPLLT